MILLPSLTSTKKDRIPALIGDLRSQKTGRIAFFPTCLSLAERRELYRDLERCPGLTLPHVHARSDFEPWEFDYLARQFNTWVFNIHPRASSHPTLNLPEGIQSMVCIENVEQLPVPEELEGMGGLCPDFSHWANAVAFKRNEYDTGMRALLKRFPVGCCHISALRVGEPNAWAGEWDHHELARPSDLDYVAEYAEFLPARWASLELENSLAEQLEAAQRLVSRLAAAGIQASL